ncbi:MAG TPA: amidase, partial [Burkholderiales bacterium]|nr:amidase [Burkholderiales bacterium]
MSSKSLPLRELLGASAAARDYPFLDRAALWEERLAMHLKDIESLGSAPQTGDMLPLPDRIPVELEASEARQAAPPASGEGEGADFAFTDAAEIVRLVQTKQVSPLEVADAFLARIERQRDLNAFITVEPDRVRDEARNLTERLARGDRLGPLAGVPVAVKDLMYVKGHPLTCGTKAMPGDIADSDAQVVANLRAAGAVILGTTNLHELAYGVTSANVHFGPVVNPVAPGHLPGGSSGGSGASVAGGLATIAVGTDTGGSIRIPAAC